MYPGSRQHLSTLELREASCGHPSLTELAAVVSELTVLCVAHHLHAAVLVVSTYNDGWRFISIEQLLVECLQWCSLQSFT